MEISHVIAQNLKNLRQERNLSLGQLAELSGVSKVMLSQLEKGETNPSVNTILKIANGLKVPYTRLIDEANSKAVVIRRADCLTQIGDEASYRLCCHFTTTPTRNFEVFTAELDAHSQNESIGHRERAQEYVLVTAGELVLETVGRQYALQAGDAICFDSSVHHTYINRRDQPLAFTIINYYP